MERRRTLGPAEPRWIFPLLSVVGAGKRSWCIPSGLRASLARRSAPISPKAAEAGLVSCRRALVRRRSTLTQSPALLCVLTGRVLGRCEGFARPASHNLEFVHKKCPRPTHRPRDQRVPRATSIRPLGLRCSWRSPPRDDRRSVARGRRGTRRQAEGLSPA